MNWTRKEVELILDDYFRMLDLEINGQPYVKAKFRRELRPKLNNRSEGSIEFKHQNISSVLMNYDLPYIVGYKPLANYQGLLEEMVGAYIQERKKLDKLFTQFTSVKPASILSKIDYSNLQIESPQPVILEEPKSPYSGKLSKPNYLEIEQNNRMLGEKGEELIVHYEKWRLIQEGKQNLADSVEWISKDAGDGAGFDILSRNLNGSDRYIEVKTTKLGELTPFYFSRNELNFSQKNSQNYFLYRVFKFNQKPNFFVKQGSFDHFSDYKPTNFIGRIK